MTIEHIRTSGIAVFWRRSFGNTYALGRQTRDPRELSRLLMKLCEKTGRRLRHAGYSAHGVHVAMVFTDLSWWHQGRKFDVPVYTTAEINVKALRLLNGSGYPKIVRDLAVSVYDLCALNPGAARALLIPQARGLSGNGSDQ